MGSMLFTGITPQIFQRVKCEVSKYGILEGNDREGKLHSPETGELTYDYDPKTHILVVNIVNSILPVFLVKGGIRQVVHEEIEKAKVVM